MNTATTARTDHVGYRARDRSSPASGSSGAPAGCGHPAPLRLRFDNFDLDEADAMLRREGRPVPLQPKAFGVLCALAREAPRLVVKESLLDSVWGHQHLSESVLKTTISELRAALCDDARQPRYIETASRRGYRFVGATGPAAAPGAASAGPERAERSAGREEAVPGRSGDALSALQASWRLALAGRRQLCWIAGASATERAALIDRFSAHAPEAVQGHGWGHEPAAARAGLLGCSEPYAPVLEALAGACRADPELVSLLRAVAPNWLRQLPWLAPDAEDRPGEGPAAPSMPREFAELIDRYTAARAPLLLVTEDLHRCDTATLRLMHMLARRRQPARLLWLATFDAAEDLGGQHPLQALRAELHLQRLCCEVVLAPAPGPETAPAPAVAPAAAPAMRSGFAVPATAFGGRLQ